MGISAPSLTALLLGVLSYSQVLSVVAALLMLAYFANRGLPNDPQTLRRADVGLIESFKEGFGILRKNKALLQVCFMVVFMNMAQGVVDANLAFLLKDRFSATDTIVGLVASCAGAGAFLGSLLAPKARKALGISKLFQASFGVNALLCVPSLLFPHPSTFALTIFGTSLLGMMQAICVWTFRQETTGSAYIGRVSGLTGAIFKLGMPIGVFVSGHLVGSFGSGILFAAACLLHLGLFLTFPFSRVAKVA